MRTQMILMRLSWYGVKALYYLLPFLKFVIKAALIALIAFVILAVFVLIF